MENTLEKVLHEIRTERQYQDEKWGHKLDDTCNTPWMWASYIAQYATNWMRGAFSLLSKDTDAFRTAMIKVAAIAIAAIESIDRQREQNGKPFYEADPA